MGKFVNPDNTAFQVALNSEIYVDKTGLIEYTNRVMDTNQALICNSLSLIHIFAVFYLNVPEAKKMVSIRI